uniref:Uncharacterized protein n=1 Tax=Arundo donax TaxID=35708 RepID=A0A0A9CIC1_ARUDO
MKKCCSGLCSSHVYSMLTTCLVNCPREFTSFSARKVKWSPSPLTALLPPPNLSAAGPTFE